MGLLKDLQDLRPQMAAAAQKIYDEWVQDKEGIDECFGSGGICDPVSDAIGEVIAEHILDVELFQGGQDGDDHAWMIAQKDGQAYGIDIRPGIYESGGGYRWQKREGVIFSAQHVEIFPVPLQDVE